MATQSAQAKLYGSFKSAVVGLKILSTDIFETAASSNSTTFTVVCNNRKIIRFTPALIATASTTIGANYTAGFLNKGLVRPASPAAPAPDALGDNFISNDDLPTAQDNYGINLISRFSSNLRIPTRIAIDLSKVTFPVIPNSNYSIKLTENFFTEKDNNRMPTPAIDLTTIATNGRPLISGYNPFNGQTSFRNNQELVLQANVENVSGTLSRGAGFYRLYENGSLVLQLSAIDATKVLINGKYITLKVSPEIDAGKNYYVLIDNGVVVDKDGFVSQAVSSTSAIAFSTAASTDVDFPDLVALQMAAAVLTLPQSEIIIYFAANLSITASMATEGTKLRIGTGTTTGTSTMVVTAVATKRFASLEMSAGTLTAQLTGTRDYASTMNATFALPNNMGKLKNFTADFTAFASKIDLMGKLLDPNSIPMEVITTSSITGNHRLRRITKNLTAVSTMSVTAYKQIQVSAGMTSITSTSPTLNVVIPYTLLTRTGSVIASFNRSFTDTTRWLKTDTINQASLLSMDMKPDATWLAYTTSTNGTIYLYAKNNYQRWTSQGTITNLTNAGLSSPNSIRWNHDGTSFAVAHAYGATANRNLTVFNINSDGSSTAQITSGLTAGSPYNTQAIDVAWNNDGSKLAVIQGTANRLRIFNRSGNTFTLSYAGGPGVYPNKVRFSPDGQQIAVGTMTTLGGLTDDPIWMANVSDMSRVTIVEPGELGEVKDIAWDPSKTYFVAVSNLAPYIYIYKNVSGTYSRLADPDVLPTNTAWSASWNDDGTMLYIAINASPYVLIYQRTGDTFTRVVPTSPTFNSGTVFVEYKGL